MVPGGGVGEGEALGNLSQPDGTTRVPADKLFEPTFTILNWFKFVKVG